MTLGIILLCSLLVIIAFASQVAGRLDKLHRRVSSSRSMLWGRIHERYQVATQLNNPEINAAVSATKKEADKRIFSPNHLLSESHLTQKLSWCDLNLEIRRAQQRLQDARRMHNEAVRATRYVRSWRISRWLRLTGRAPAPNFVDFDDSLFPIQNRD